MSSGSTSARDGRLQAITHAPLTSLHPHPENPRRISRDRLDQLKQTLTADPDMLAARPLIALPDGTVLAGNQRLRAAQELGWETIPVVYADIDEQTARLWMLRDNNSFGDWDEQPLAELLAQLEAGGVELALAGFEGGTVDGLLAGLEKGRGRPDPDEAPPVPAKPRSVRGCVYELGPHRLTCGDATAAGDVSALVAGHAAQAVWTDPPYGVEYVGKTRKALTLANDGAAGLPALLRGALTATDAILEPGAPFYAAAPAGPRHIDFLAAIAEVGWTLHQTLIWVKDVMVLGHADYHYRHEPILYGWKPGPGRSGRGNHKGSRWHGDNAQTTVFEVARPRRSVEHPTMKPVELIEPMLANSTRRGDVVYDPFAGSGSTMIAADKLGRRCFMVEIDPGYCDVIRDRWEAWNA